MNDLFRNLKYGDLKDVYAQFDKQLTDALRSNGWDTKEAGIEQLLLNNYENKSDLRNILSKHPDWKESEQAIIFNLTLPPCYDNAMSVFSEFKSMALYVLRKDIKPCSCAACRSAYGTLCDNCGNGAILRILLRAFLDSDLKGVLDVFTAGHLRDHGLKASKGQKLSKVINKWASSCGIDKHSQYQPIFARLSDVLNAKEIHRTAVLSLHPVDFLLMSNGVNWSSCHDIDRHEEKDFASGPLSYLQDTASMILFTLPVECEDVHRAPKIARQMFHFEDGLLLQGRLYPEFRTTIIQCYRHAVQDIMAKCLSASNEWTLYTCLEEVQSVTVTDSTATHYRDYDFGRNCTLSVLKDYISRRSINIGHCPICVACGLSMHEKKSLLCMDCGY